MTQEITTNLMCIVMRNNIIIWIEKERAEKLYHILPTITQSKFIEFDGRMINTADISGIFTPQDMEDYTRRKNGQWKCDKGNWHERKEECNCLTSEQIKRREEYKESYKNQYGFEPIR